MIKITTTNHILDQIIKRIKKITTKKEADKYIKDKFSRMIVGDNIGRNHGEVYKKTLNDKLVIYNNLHRIIYIKKGLEFILVTYYLSKNYK